MPLRVELHHRRRASPWADLPLLKELYRWFQQERPILVADVKPGIEWALRPRAKEGQHFRVRLMTKSGVLVCAKGLRRGQALDFQVPVPPAPAQLRLALAERPQKVVGTVQGRIKATEEACKALGSLDVRAVIVHIQSHHILCEIISYHIISYDHMLYRFG